LVLHEYVVASGVVDSVAKFAGSVGGRVKSFRVLVGELSMLDIGLIRELLGEMARGAGLSEASISVEIERAAIRCGSCGAEMSFSEAVEGLTEEERESMHFVPDLVSSFARCKKCGCPDLRVVSGRGVKVVDVVVGRPE
jgi:Zn finger protein HypA/HybF involved in hydrogenase expression